MQKRFIDNGDFVVLKGVPNSPVMKAQNVREKGKVVGINCFWFDLNHQPHEKLFHTNELEHAPAPEVVPA